MVFQYIKGVNGCVFGFLDVEDGVKSRSPHGSSAEIDEFDDEIPDLPTPCALMHIDNDQQK